MSASSIFACAQPPGRIDSDRRGRNRGRVCQRRRERFWVNWLVWTLFLLTLGLGNLFLVALERLVGAHWSVPMRRVPERIASLIPLAIPLLLVAFRRAVIFPWTYPEAAHNPILVAKAAWLNLPFFAIRLAVCAVVWMLFYRFYVRGSLRQDESRIRPSLCARADWRPPSWWSSSSV